MSQYVGALGQVLPASAREDYKWIKGVCVNTKTGVPYSGDQRNSNCQGLFGPPPTGITGVLSFLTETAKERFGRGDLSPRAGQPTPGLTGSGLLIPAVIGVGVLALVLASKKDKS